MTEDLTLRRVAHNALNIGIGIAIGFGASYLRAEGVQKQFDDYRNSKADDNSKMTRKMEGMAKFIRIHGLKFEMPPLSVDDEPAKSPIREKFTP